MLSLLIVMATASAQAAAPAPAPAALAPAPAGRRLQDLPGIAITYHDLSEKDVKGINKTLKARKTLSAAQQQLLAASTNWKAGADMTRLTKGETCTVSKAKATFSATANLPRFNEAWVEPEQLPAWRKFIADIETHAAAKLWYPYERLSEVEQAIVGKACDQALKDGAAVMERIKAEAAAYQPPVATAPPPAPAK